MCSHHKIPQQTHTCVTVGLRDTYRSVDRGRKLIVAPDQSPCCPAQIRVGLAAVTRSLIRHQDSRRPWSPGREPGGPVTLTLDDFEGRMRTARYVIEADGRRGRRSAMSGSTRVARHAGTRLATTACTATNKDLDPWTACHRRHSTQNTRNTQNPEFSLRVMGLCAMCATSA